MMNPISVEQFRDKIDSLYRLVIVASRRAAQGIKPDARTFGLVRPRKPTMAALQEILDGKVTYRIVTDDEEEYVE